MPAGGLALGSKGSFMLGSRWQESRHIPEAHRLVVAARRKDTTLGEEGKGGHRLAVAWQRRQQRVRFRIPQNDPFVLAARGHLMAAGAIGSRPDFSRMFGFEERQFLARVNVPDLDIGPAATFHRRL